MPKLKIDDIEPGMVLAEDLTTAEGRMLLPRGAVITDAHLRTCRVWGIVEAVIQGDEDEDENPTSLDQLHPEVLDACKILAAQRFVLNPSSHPVVQEMAKLYVLRQARGVEPEQARWMLSATTHDDDVGLFCQPETPEARINPSEVVKQEMELASLPNIFYQISEALKNPRSSAAYVAEVISKDVALSAKLLKMVNTPFYGFPSEIDTLSRAVTIVGTNQLVNLALGVSVITAFEGIPEKFFTLKEFWLHSVMCGIVARLLAGKLGMEGDEKFFVAGLLHDIGRLIILRSTSTRPPKCCARPPWAARDWWKWSSRSGAAPTRRSAGACSSTGGCPHSWRCWSITTTRPPRRPWSARPPWSTWRTSSPTPWPWVPAARLWCRNSTPTPGKP